MAIGRPPQYDTKKTPAAVEAYVRQAVKGRQLPTIEGLAANLKVARSTLYQWADIHAEFSDILEHLLALQANSLIQGGLYGRFNSTITKLMLTKHGYVERQELTGKDGEPLMTDDNKQKSKAAIASFFNRGNS